MYYQHYVIFEALRVICKQLKIIYYPKLYRSTLRAYEFLSLKTVWFWYIYTHLHLSLSDTLCSVTMGTCFHTWKKRGRCGKVTGHGWPLPGRHSPPGFGFCLWKPHREDIALKSPLVPDVPPRSPSLTPLPRALRMRGLGPTAQNDTETPPSLKDACLSFQPWAPGCDVMTLHSRLTPNTISRTQP